MAFEKCLVLLLLVNCWSGVTEAQAATVSLDQSEYLTYEGNTISVCVNLDGAITEAVVVAFTTEDGTAVSTTTEGQVADYTPVSENLTFQPSSSTRICVTLDAFLDTEGEDREYFTVRIALLSGGINVTEGSANVFINGDSCAAAGYSGCCMEENCGLGNCYCDRQCHELGDCCDDIEELELPCLPAAISIKQVNYSVSEEGIGSVGICVTVSAIDDDSFTITLATEDGSAVSGGQAPDYLPVLMNLTVVRNDDECVNVTIYDDDLLEGTESFSVRISLATEVPDVSIDINRADVFILDDEVATCPLDTAGGILWPLTEEGREAVENCSQAGPFYREGPVARRRCSEGGEWGVADFTGCTLTDSVSEPFLLLSMVIEAEGVGDGGQLEEEMATILTERNVSFTSVTLVSSYIASIALTFEVKLNTSVDYQSSLTDFVQYFDEELTTLGEYDIRNGSKGTLAVVPSDTCQCQTSEMSSILQLCTEASTNPCDCSGDQCTCQAPFVGDGNDCTLDSDGDGYPDVPLGTCEEGNEAIYCIKDVCPNVFNPEQDPRDCQDALASISIEQVSYSVAEDGTGSVDICVTVTATYNDSFTVTLATEDGSAVSVGQAPDYLSVSMNLTVRNTKIECVSVTIYDDDLLEGTETFSVRISLASGAPDTVNISMNHADVFILDDEMVSCQAPFVGDGNDCTLDSDGDGYPDVPLASCDEDNEAIYCIKDVCRNVFNPEQDPRDCQSCPPGPDDQFMITWRYTEPGMTDTQPCPEGADGTARRMCGSDGQWEDPDVLDCQSQMFIDIADSVMTIQSSENLTVEEITMMTSEITDRLINATEPESVSLLPRDINTTNFVISSLLEISEGSLNITVDLDIVEVFDNLLNDSNSVGFNQLQMNDSGSQSVLDNAERYGLLIARNLNSTNDEVLLSRPNIVVKASLYNLDNNQSLEFPNETDLVNYVRAEQGRPPARIEIPPEVLEERMGDELAVSVVNILFRNLEDFLPSSSQQSGTDRSAISVVLSSQVGTQRDTLMSTSGSAIKLSFVAERVEEILGSTYNYTCNYWNFSRPVGNGDWINDGIMITNITRTENATIVEAESLHLTSFAVLVDVAGGQEDVPDAEKMALQIVSYIGCTISVICLVITIGFFLLEGKQLLSAVHHFIHINLALALLLGYLLFLVGVETATASTGGCAFVAALLQYFFLSAFCWMLCEGIMLYLMLVVVFSTLSKKWWMFLLIGWVTPVPIVVIGVGARHEYYGVRVNGELEFCWLSTEKGTIWGFVVPMLVIILINVVFLVFALRALWRSKTGQVVQKTDSSVNVRELAKVLFRATIILLPLLGLTWVFGILTLDENTTVFAWLFAIFNSVQGLMFFIFHVIRSDKVWSRITPLFSNIHKRVRSSTFGQKYEMTGNAGTSSTMLKGTLNRPTSDNTGTLKSESKSMDAEMLSISSSPVSVGDDSRIELDVIVSPPTALDQEKLKPRPPLTDVPEHLDMEPAKQENESHPDTHQRNEENEV